MAGKKLVELLDRKLIEGKVIEKKFESDYALVHRKMNSIIKKTGRVLSDEVFARGDAVMREWLLTLYKQGASQEKLTGYLRCALAHLSLDYIDSTYKKIDDEDLVTRALLSFKSRKFHKSFFKVSAADKVKVKPVKQAPRAKKTVVKSASAKKGTVSVAKKVASKKDAPKKAVGKPAVKNAGAKKGVASTKKLAKTPVKKTAATKVAVKKPGAKKAVSKKAPAGKSAAHKGASRAAKR